MPRSEPTTARATATHPVGARRDRERLALAAEADDTLAGAWHGRAMATQSDPSGAPPANQSMTVQADAGVVPGVYCNLTMIAHRREEFVLDFLFVQPQRGPNGEALACLRSRVISSPEHTKRVLRALEENVRRYEAAFGTIE